MRCRGVKGVTSGIEEVNRVVGEEVVSVMCGRGNLEGRVGKVGDAGSIGEVWNVTKTEFGHMYPSSW